MPYDNMPFKNKQAAKADRNNVSAPNGIPGGAPVEPKVPGTSLTESQIDKSMKAMEWKNANPNYKGQSTSEMDAVRDYKRAAGREGYDPKNIREAGKFVEKRMKDKTGFEDMMKRYEQSK